MLSEKLDLEHDRIIKVSKPLNQKTFEKIRDAEMDFIANKGKELVQSCVDITSKVKSECNSGGEEKISKCILDHMPETFNAMKKHSPFVNYIVEKHK